MNVEFFKIAMENEGIDKTVDILIKHGIDVKSRFKNFDKKDDESKKIMLCKLIELKEMYEND